MTAQNETIAESIIKSEGLAFALASEVGKEGDLREARGLLKERIMKEIADAEWRGNGTFFEASSGHVTIPSAQHEALMVAAKALAHVYRDDGCGEESNAEMRAALAALRAAGL